MCRRPFRAEDLIIVVPWPPTAVNHMKKKFRGDFGGTHGIERRNFALDRLPMQIGRLKHHSRTELRTE
jgi:hypothetical protein